MPLRKFFRTSQKGRSELSRSEPCLAGYRHTSRTYYHARDETPLETAVNNQKTWLEAGVFVDKVPKREKKDSIEFLPQMKNALFCGHLMADLDSIAGAIAAAHLYGGTPARASDLNSETKWALEKWKCDSPDMIDALLQETPTQDVCLVDFQQQSQLHPSIQMRNIIGIIDHHALQNNTIITERPIIVDIRPWGSMSSILAHTYAVHEIHLPMNIAGLLLSAILSDTLNLRSPTTTKWDERMVSMLVQYMNIDDVNVLAAAQFRAKSHELNSMTSYQLVNGDMKQFKFGDRVDKSVVYTIGYGVIETTDAASSMARLDDLIGEMQQVRTEKDLTAMLLAVVDIVNMTSSLLLCGEVEESLAIAAYGAEEMVQNKRVLELKGKVSRKLDFIPPLSAAVTRGWKPPTPPLPRPKRHRSSIIVMDYSSHGTQIKRVYVEDDSEDDLHDKEAGKNDGAVPSLID